MRAMILAAGEGKRMQSLTQTTPKPLLRVKGRYLIDYALMAIKAAGIYEVVINIAYHANQIKAALGDGQQYGIAIAYSEEATPLETGGGIQQALSLLGTKPFLAMSSDIITDFSLQQLPSSLAGLAHLVVVANPSYHSQGDFCLQAGDIKPIGYSSPTITFANIGLYHPELFSLAPNLSTFPLSAVLFPAIKKAAVTGQYYTGYWRNIGTPLDLAEVNGEENRFA